MAIDTEGDGSVVVKGTPVSRGVYKGRARVVTRLADAESIQKVQKFLECGRTFSCQPSCSICT